MNFRCLSLLLLFFSPLCAIATEVSDPLDNSKAGTDGPHVFYRGDKIIVKYVVMRDTGARAISQTFYDKKAISLRCAIPETGDKFSFSLREHLPESETFYPESSKILALSDIEGDFAALKLMLQSAGVMDEQFNWTFGTGHLVLDGDFFDRGLNVTECLWLLYKLDGEAEAAGGHLHFILGNHEILNLQANTQYVRNKYLEVARLIGMDYKYWYDNHTELGRWLRSKNAVEKIGDYVFCHAGISPDLVSRGLSLADINRISRANLGKAYCDITNPDAQAIFNIQTGIFWYRGLAKNRLSEEDVSQILQYTGGKRLVIGHTLQNDVTGLYGNRVLCIDLFHEENLREGFMKTLWIEDGYCYVLDSRGEKSTIYTMTFPRKTD